MDAPAESESTRATVVFGAVATTGALSMHYALPSSAPLPAVAAAWIVYGAAVAAMAWSGIVAPLRAGLAAERRSRLDGELRTAAESRRRTLVTRIDRAVDDARNEPELIELLGRTMVEVFEERDNAILLCRGGDSEVVWSLPVAAGGIDVPTELEDRPHCAALRSAQLVTSASTTDIGACPHDAVDPITASSVCVPIPLGDGFVGVASSRGAPGELPPPEDIEVVEMMCRRVGASIAAIRDHRAERARTTGHDPAKVRDHRDAIGLADDDLAAGIECSIALCDIDGFSGYTDRHGAEAADRAIEVYLDVIDATLRPSDVVSRYAGDRFLCVLSSCSAAQATSAMERVREALVLSLASDEIPPFGVSVGVADSTVGDGVDGLVEAADVALAVAKQGGGNRVQSARFSDAGLGDGD